MHSGTKVTTKDLIAKQRAVSRKIIATIEYQKQKEEENEKKKVKNEKNAYWLKRLIASVEEAFVHEVDVVEMLREKVFSKWKNFRYHRDAYLAPKDIYRELEQLPEEYTLRVQNIENALREERKALEC